MPYRTNQNSISLSKKYKHNFLMKIKRFYQKHFLFDTSSTLFLLTSKIARPYCIICNKKLQPKRYYYFELLTAMCEEHTKKK